MFFKIKKLLLQKANLGEYNFQIYYGSKTVSKATITQFYKNNNGLERRKETIALRS